MGAGELSHRALDSRLHDAVLVGRRFAAWPLPASMQRHGAPRAAALGLGAPGHGLRLARGGEA
eukprot:8859499-Lingulodinium_polyedra.AAC.1